MFNSWKLNHYLRQFFPFLRWLVAFNWVTFSHTQTLALIASMLNLAGTLLNNKIFMVLLLEVHVPLQSSLEVFIHPLLLLMEDAVPLTFPLLLV